MASMQEPADPAKYLEDEYAALNGWHRGLTPALEPDDFLNEGPRVVARHWARSVRPSLATEAIDEMTAGLQASALDKVVATVEQLQDDYRSEQRCREAHEDVVRRRRVSQAEAVLADVMRGYPAKATADELSDAVNAVIAARGPVVDHRAGDFLHTLEGALESLADTHKRGWLGLRVPSFRQLDEKLCGLRGLMLLGAGPGVGKTQLTVQLGTDVLHDPEVALVYLTLEMSKRELGYRLLSMASGIGYRRLRIGGSFFNPGMKYDLDYEETIRAREEERRKEALRRQMGHLRLNDTELRKINDGVELLRKWGTRIAMFGPEDIGALQAGGRDPSRWYAPLKTLIEDAKRRRGAARALVVVDNLQAVAVEPTNGKPWISDLDRDRVVIEGLTRLQHDLDDPVLVVSEVTKGSFKGADAMGSILGTGRNTYRADAVMLLKRHSKDEPPYESNDHRLDLVIDKGRDGMVRGTVELQWSDDYAMLSEVSAATSWDGWRKKP
jgi:replicative DNA helicase